MFILHYEKSVHTNNGGLHLLSEKIYLRNLLAFKISIFGSTVKHSARQFVHDNPLLVHVSNLTKARKGIILSVS